MGEGDPVIDQGALNETVGVQNPAQEVTLLGKLERHRALHGARLTFDSGPAYTERLALLGLDPNTTDPIN